MFSAYLRPRMAHNSELNVRLCVCLERECVDIDMLKTFDELFKD